LESSHKKRLNENAVVTIRSFQKTDDDSDSSELNTTACYSYKGNGRGEILYTELDEQGKPCGDTTITVFSNELVSIRKTGFTEAVMILETGKTHTAAYNTMLGSMEMRLCATDIICFLHENGGSIRLKYLLDIGEEYSAVNTIDLQIKLRES